jgi:hypothetical protein
MRVHHSLKVEGDVEVLAGHDRDAGLSDRRDGGPEGGGQELSQVPDVVLLPPAGQRRPAGGIQHEAEVEVTGVSRNVLDE